MKILVVANIAGFGSGTFSFLKRLIEIHKSKGFITEILLPFLSADKDVVKVLTDLGATVKINRYKRTDLFTKAYFSLLYDFLYVITSYLKFKPDLVHVTHGTPKHFLGCFLLPCPVLHTLHTVPEGKLRLGMRLFVSGVMFLKNKTFITVSEFSKNAIIDKYGVSRKKIHVVYNSAMVISPEVLFQKHNKQKNNKRILTIGHVVEYKNPSLWINVATEIIAVRSDVNFVWAGEGELRKQLMAIIDKKDLNNNIQFIGFEKDVDKLYRSSDIYFQPSLIESHGIAVIDAMGYGLPCVVSDAGGLPESVINTETGYICMKDNVREYAEKILLLISDDDLSNQFGKKGYQIALEKFSIKMQEKSILEIYKKSLSVVNV